MAHSDRDPEVIDVTRDFVGFRGKGDRYSRHAYELSLCPPRLRMLTALAVSMWQSEIEYVLPQSSVERRESGTAGGTSFAVPRPRRARGPLNCKLRLFEARTQSTPVARSLGASPRRPRVDTLFPIFNARRRRRCLHRCRWSRLLEKCANAGAIGRKEICVRPPTFR